MIGTSNSNMGRNTGRVSGRVGGRHAGRGRAMIAAAALGVAWGLSAAVSAQSVWNGPVGGAWGTSGNWTGGVPTSSSNVTFVAAGSTTTAGVVTSVLDASYQVAKINFDHLGTAAAPTYHRLDVGVNTLTVSNAATTTMHVVGPRSTNGTDTTNVAFTGTGSGSVVFAVGGDLTFQRSPTVAPTSINSTADFSGVPSLRLSAANVFVGRSMGNGASGFGSARSRVVLADVSTLAGTGSVTVGSALAYTAASGGSATGSLTGATGVLLVGRDTTVRTPNFIVGAGKSNGAVLVTPGVTSGSFTLSGTTPGTRAALWGIGEWNATTDQSTTPAFGTVNLTGVTVNALVTTLSVGRGPNSSGLGLSGATGVLIFDNGTIDATSVNLGVKRQVNAQTAGTGTATIGTPGGTASSPMARLLVSGDVRMGLSENAGTISNASAVGTMVLHAGGTVSVSGNVVDGGANGGAVLSQSNITLNPHSQLAVAGTLGTTAAPVDNLSVNGGTLSLATKTVGSASASVTTLTTGLDTTNITISGGPLTPGSTYTLIKYGTLNNFNFFLPTGAVTGLGARSTATLLNNLDTGSIDLKVEGDSPLWTGTLDGTWSLATQSAPKNWLLVTALTPTDFIDTDSVLFDDQATNRNVNIVSTVMPTSVAVNSTGDYTFSGSGSIAGSTAVLKQGPSTLTISNANTFSGPVTVAEGTLEAASSAALGTGTALSVAAGARLSLSGSTSISGRTATIQGDGVSLTGALYGAGGTTTWGGGVVLAGAARIGVAADSSLTVAGNISGGTTLTLGGQGRIVLSGTNTFGTTTAATVGAPPSLTIDDGVTVDLASGAALPGPSASTGSLWLKSGTLNFNGNNAVAGGTAANATNRWSIGGGATGTSATIDTGSGLLTLSGSFTAQNPNGLANVGLDGGLSLTATIAGRVDLGANAAPAAAGVLANVRVITVFNAAPDVDLLVSAVVSGTGIGLSKAGGGTLRLTADNTFDGGVHLGTGFIEIASDASLGAVPMAPAPVISYSGGGIRLLSSFDINANRSIVMTNAGGLSGQINTGEFTSTYAGSVSNSVGTTGGLTKSGGGRLTLTGNLSYVGPTTVTGGELVVAVPLVSSSSIVTGTGTAAGATVVLAAPHAALGTYGYAGNVSSVAVAEFTTVRISPADRATQSPNVLVTNSLQINVDEFSAYKGLVDLTNNDLIVRGTSPETLTAMVKQWFAGGLRNGAGIGSSVASAAAYTTVAVFPNNDGSGSPYFASYDGVTGLSASDVILKYTYEGDTNLDGVVNGQDLVNAIEGYSIGLTGWANGDFDYSGTVTATDIDRLILVLGAGLPSLGNGQGGMTGGGSIPEPVAIGLLLPAAALLSRKRR